LIRRSNPSCSADSRSARFGAQLDSTEQLDSAAQLDTAEQRAATRGHLDSFELDCRQRPFA